MLKSAFEKLVGGKTEFETYTLLRLQAKTYRLVKNYVTPILEKRKLSTLDWSLLGLLKKYPKGCRFIQISQQMGVEPPFVTELVNSIKKLKLIKTEPDPEDRRAKTLLLTDKGADVLTELEKQIEEKLAQVLSGISASDFQTYTQVMQKLTEQIEEKGSNR